MSVICLKKRRLKSAVIIFCLLHNSINANQLFVPEITFTYNWASHIMDFIGGLYFRIAVTLEQQRQLQQQLPDFIAAWDKNAPIFFDEIFSQFKRGFKDKKRTAIINLSHNWSYGSYWFLIFGLPYYLDPEPWGCSIARTDGFCDLVFHELLHVWVDENINTNKSLLFEKYKYEDHHTLEHLHLMALQKMVYINLSRFDMVAFIDESYRERSLLSYKRAWEIVNEIEGYEAILNDIANNLCVN